MSENNDWQHDGECSSLYGRALGREDKCDCGTEAVWPGSINFYEKAHSQLQDTLHADTLEKSCRMGKS